MNVRSKSAVETVAFLDQKLTTQKKLYYVRFGDGEIEIMKGVSYRNHQANKEIQKELCDSFNINDPDYLIGVSVNMDKDKRTSRGVCSQYPQNDKMISFLANKGFIKDGDVFESQTSFTYTTLFKWKYTYRFFEKHIRYKRKMFIGGTPRNISEKVYGPITHYIQTPLRNAYSDIDKWWPEIENNINDVELVIVSAGVSSNVIAKRLWYINAEVQLLDIGSIVDAISENKSRKWISLLGHRVQRILPPEFREKSLTRKFIHLLKDIRYFFRQLIVQ